MESHLQDDLEGWANIAVFPGLYGEYGGMGPESPTNDPYISPYVIPSNLSVLITSRLYFAELSLRTLNPKP